MTVLRSFGVLLIIVLVTFTSQAQRNEDWFNKDLEEDGVFGASVNKVYAEYGNRSTTEIIVAIIDSGVDFDHEDLQDNIWVNEDEIAGNGLDDDNNGYVDDIHGWNFLGGANGNVVEETFETTRLYKKLREKFDGRSKDDISDSEQEDYKLYLETKKITEDKLAQSKKTKEQLDQFEQTLMMVKSILEPELLDKEINEANLEAIHARSERVLAAKEFMLSKFQAGFTFQDFEDYKKYIDTRVLYHYNIEFDGRRIVGDNPDDPSERFYGNNDVDGGHSEHGTHVAGIIGAVRNNETGIDGIAGNVKLMILRAVPDGDERDKDIANSIIYAVDNGARIINMSFGKGHSPNKEAVEAAIKYAEDNNVLLIHAAGNASMNIDEVIHFPTRYFGDPQNPIADAQNWIEVGASDRTKDLNLTAEFSNYGNKTVHVFAPGVDIYSTVPDNEYKENSGTSMAAPVVSGVAALVLSHHPELTAVQLKEILLESAIPVGKTKVYLPADKRGKKTKFKKLSTTGAVINAYQAMKLAESMSGNIAD